MENYLAQEIKVAYNSKVKRSELPGVKSSKDAYKYLAPLYENDVNLFESCIMLILNRSNKIVGWYKLSSGGVAGTVIDVKICSKIALDCLASGVILSHNHPSGNSKASNEDIKITEKVKNALKLFDIQLLDHLILFEDGFTSFADEGLI